MRTRPGHMSLRTTEMLRAMLLDTAKELEKTQTAVLEAGIILARKYYQRYGNIDVENSTLQNDFFNII